MKALAPRRPQKRPRSGNQKAVSFIVGQLDGRPPLPSPPVVLILQSWSPCKVGVLHPGLGERGPTGLQENSSPHAAWLPPAPGASGACFPGANALSAAAAGPTGYLKPRSGREHLASEVLA